MLCKFRNDLIAELYVIQERYFARFEYKVISGRISYIATTPTNKIMEVSHKDASIIMMTSSNGIIFRVTGHLCGEFTGHL